MIPRACGTPPLSSVLQQLLPAGQPLTFGGAVSLGPFRLDAAAEVQGLGVSEGEVMG